VTRDAHSTPFLGHGVELATDERGHSGVGRFTQQLEVLRPPGGARPLKRRDAMLAPSKADGFKGSAQLACNICVRLGPEQSDLVLAPIGHLDATALGRCSASAATHSELVRAAQQTRDFCVTLRGEAVWRLAGGVAVWVVLHCRCRAAVVRS
jgi:hypothetical protein